MIEIELQEWQEREIELDPAQAQSLARHGGEAITVRATGQPGRYLVRAANLVGGFRTEEASLLVRPKAKIENVFALMGIDIPSLEWLRQQLLLTDVADLLPAVIRFYAVSLETALRAGTHRDYEERRSAERALRGRPDFPRIVSSTNSLFPVACRFGEYTPDIPLNRYLRAALRRSSRVAGLGRLAVRRLRRLDAALSSVAAVHVDPRWDQHWQPTRLDQRFETPVRLAAVILQNLTLRDEAGTTPVRGFWIDMNQVFEMWVTAELRRALRGRADVESQVWTHLDRERRVGMRPDIVIKIDGAPVLVADCKYKLQDGEGRNSDYYQTLAYATAYGLPSATLIYARLPGSELVDPLRVRGAEIEIHTLGVDLTVPASGLRGEVQTLAHRLLDLIPLREGVAARDDSMRSLPPRRTDSDQLAR